MLQPGELCWVKEISVILQCLGSSDNLGIILQFTGRHFLGVHRSSPDLFKSIASD